MGYLVVLVLVGLVEHHSKEVFVVQVDLVVLAVVVGDCY